MTTNRPVCAVLACLASASPALAQAGFRAAFVANDGNLEGSVTSFRVEPDGDLTLIDRVITGARESITEDVPGCNPYAISVSPSGRYLLTSHAAGGPDSQIAIIDVAPDGSLSLATTLDVPSTPLDCAWISDTLLTATRTSFGATNEAIVYSFDPETLALVETDRGLCGAFTSSVAAHPNGQWIYAGDSTNDLVYAFDVSPAGVVTPIGSASTSPGYALGVRVSPNGRFLFAAGGISNGGDKISAFVINQTTGELTPVPGSPFISPGASPARMTISTDSRVLYMGHGTDATCRSFLIDQESGALTSTGFSYDVGLQGTLGGLAALPGLLLLTDDSTAIDGVRGLLSFSEDTSTGAFTPITPAPVSTEGVTPESIAVWDPALGCSDADLAEPFGALDFSDVLTFLAAFGASEPAADLAEPVGVWDFSDVLAFLNAFAAGCP